MSRDFILYLEDIMDAIRAIREYTAGMTFEGFVADRKTVDAAVRNLEIIGEAAGKLPNDILGSMPEIEWRKIIAMRNILAHAYFGVSKPIVWDVIQNKLPALQEACRRCLKESE